jgi:hypothetical protein
VRKLSTVTGRQHYCAPQGLAQGTNDLSEVVPLLADLLSIPTSERYPPLNLTPQKRKERTLHAQLAQVEGRPHDNRCLWYLKTCTGATPPRENRSICSLIGLRRGTRRLNSPILLSFRFFGQTG